MNRHNTKTAPPSVNCPPGTEGTLIAILKWSEEKHPRFEPSEEFQKPLGPWEPRED